MHRFPCLQLALDALREGGAAPTIANAANEVAVAAFLDGHIGFMDIPQHIERTLDHLHHTPAPQSLEDVLAIDCAAREKYTK